MNTSLECLAPASVGIKLTKREDGVRALATKVDALRKKRQLLALHRAIHPGAYVSAQVNQAFQVNVWY